MYGTLFTNTRRPITGKEYIELLEKHKPHLEWDSESEESFWEFNDGDVEGEVWYPSLFSIKYARFYPEIDSGNDWIWWKTLTWGE
jgi:hypothetical protein